MSRYSSYGLDTRKRSADKPKKSLGHCTHCNTEKRFGFSAWFQQFMICESCIKSGLKAFEEGRHTQEKECWWCQASKPVYITHPLVWESLASEPGQRSESFAICSDCLQMGAGFIDNHRELKYSKSNTSNTEIMATKTAASNGKGAAKEAGTQKKATAKPAASKTNGTTVKPAKEEVMPEVPVNPLEMRLQKVQLMDGMSKDIKTLRETHEELSEFNTYSSDSLQLILIDSEQREFKTTNSTFIMEHVEFSLKRLAERKNEIETQLMAMQL